jgi:hypothetical protein
MGSIRCRFPLATVSHGLAEEYLVMNQIYSSSSDANLVAISKNAVCPIG